MSCREPEFREEVRRSIEQPAGRLHLHVREVQQRPGAQRLLRELDSTDLPAMGVELLDLGPPSTELHCFRPQDQPEADRLARRLTELGIPTRPENANRDGQLRVPERHFELWIAPGVDPAPKK